MHSKITGFFTTTCSLADLNSSASYVPIASRGIITRNIPLTLLLSTIDLAKSANNPALGGQPVIALQEFPRVGATGNTDFEREIKQKFPGYKLVFGKKELGHHENSQLCILVPPGKTATSITLSGQDPRIQIVVIDKIAYVNIHPSPHLTKPQKDPIQEQLKGICDQLFASGKCEKVHIVGDWNRQSSELTNYWTQVDSSEEKSHYPPFQYMQPNTPQNQNSWPKPIDHHVEVKKS